MNAKEFVDNLGYLADDPKQISQLRTMILDLAFKGYLSNDHTIEPFENWKTSSIEGLSTEVFSGFACSKKNEDPNGHVHLRTHNVGKDGKLNFDQIVKIKKEEVDSKKSCLKKGDLIFNNTNSQELVGKTCVVDQDYNYGFSNHLTICRFNAEIEPDFVARYFNLLLKNGTFSNLCKRWIGQAGINTKVLKALNISFPDRQSQVAIIEEIERLYSLCDELEAKQQERRAVHARVNTTALGSLSTAETDTDFDDAWSRVRSNFDLLYSVPENVSTLRQTILQLAVQGKLVEQDPNDEPASDLLKEIQRNKEGLKQAGTIRGKEKLHRKAKPKPPPYKPDGWEWVRFREVIWCYRGHNPPKSDFINEPRKGFIRFIQITDFKTDSRAVYVPITEKLKRVYRGEIIMAAYRHIGKVSRNVEGAFNVALCKVNDIKPINRDFIELLISTSLVKGELLSESERGHIPSMHSDHLLSLWIPVPPLAEQQRIVAKVDELMALCDDLEAKLMQQQGDADRLTEAMVAAVLDSVAA